jgi:hypothetical protein
LLALIDLSLAMTKEQEMEWKEAIKNTTPKQREIFSKVLDITKKYKEKQEKEEEEEKLRNLQSTDTTDGEVGNIDVNGTNPKAGLQFLNFGGYSYSSGTITFNIFFYFLIPIPNKIWVPLIVHSKRLRSLADTESEAECKPSGTVSEKDSQGGVSQKFKCTASVDPSLAVSGVEIDPNRPIYIDDGSGKHPYEGTTSFSKEASEQASNIQNCEEDIDKLLMLQEGKLEGTGDSDGKFQVTGNLVKIADTQLNLNLTNSTGEKVIVPCSITSGDGSATLDCTVSEQLKDAEIHMRSGLTDDKKTKIVMNMQNGENAKISESPTSGTANYHKSSSGLSGGAIAGIVIACVVVLIAAAVAAIMLRKPSVPPTDNTTVTGLNAVENV